MTHIEFVCRDCRANVIAYGYERPPEKLLCSVCAWIDECISPHERDALRDRLGHPLKGEGRGDAAEQPPRPPGFVVGPVWQGDQE
jgi:hypothetical protein